MKTVLLIADEVERYYFEPFLLASADMHTDVKIFICDPTRFPTRAAVNAQLDQDGVITGFLDVLQLLQGSYVGSRVRLEEVDLGWYLRAGRAVPEKAMTEIEARFAQNESDAALFSVLACLNCQWINRRDSIRFLNGNKLYQQAIASQCGLATPPTMLSNNPDDVVAFARPRQEVLIKSITYTALDNTGKHFIYSNLFSHIELEQAQQSIRECPVYVQEYIRKRYEYRVMVIGNEVLSCRIDSQASEKTRVDWRHYDFSRVEHMGAELPHDIQTRLLSLMDRLKLKYGAIDLIETPEGEFVFLEVNPSGQWHWIAVLAGLPIPEAVARMLRAG